MKPSSLHIPKCITVLVKLVGIKWPQKTQMIINFLKRIFQEWMHFYQQIFKKDIKLNLHLTTVVCSVTIIFQRKAVDLASGLANKLAIFPKYRPLTSLRTSSYIPFCEMSGTLRGRPKGTECWFSHYPDLFLVQLSSYISLAGEPAPVSWSSIKQRVWLLNWNILSR